jgi:hypothetical protein
MLSCDVPPPQSLLGTGASCFSLFGCALYKQWQLWATMGTWAVVMERALCSSWPLQAWPPPARRLLASC